MTSNDNRPPMSPLGQAVFDMMNNINRVTYTTQRLQEMSKPKVEQPIKRISEEQSHGDS